MNVFTGAAPRLVAYSGLHPRKPYKAAILHTNGGGAQLFGWWSQIAAKGQRVGAQYQVFFDGRVECYVDPDLVVYHAYAASEWAIGIETEDDGDNRRPWTPEQIAAIAGILHHHEVPARMLTGPGPGDGVGYHQQYQVWNQNGHDCVGAVRRAQIPQVLAALQQLNNPQEDYVATLDPADKADLIQQITGGVRPADHHDTNPRVISNADILTAIEKLPAQIAAALKAQQ